jgi:hypothetical protein
MNIAALLIAVVELVVIVAIGFWLYTRQRRREGLRKQFGPAEASRYEETWRQS